MVRPPQHSKGRSSKGSKREPLPDPQPTLAEARRFYLDLPVGTEPDTASVAGAAGGLEERSGESATTRVSNPRQ